MGERARHGGAASLRRLAVHRCDSRDHRERGGVRWLLPERSKAALWFGVFAAGLSVSCICTRYHHGVNVLAGLTVAAIASALGYRLTRDARSPQYVAGAVHGRTTVQTGA